ncbi:MAG: ATP-binding protein [Balneolaceae bacterium]
MNSKTTYQINISASTRNLSDVRDFITNHAESYGFVADQIADIRLAVDEAVTNIIKHAYQNDPSQEINISLKFNDPELCIFLTDTGKTFEFGTYQQPDIKKQIEQKKRGGMGVYLIHSLMDKVTYTRKGQKNRMIMCKNRK